MNFFLSPSRTEYHLLENNSSISSPLTAHVLLSFFLSFNFQLEFFFFFFYTPSTSLDCHALSDYKDTIIKSMSVDKFLSVLNKNKPNFGGVLPCSACGTVQSSIGMQRIENSRNKNALSGAFQSSPFWIKQQKRPLCGTLIFLRLFALNEIGHD
jgi:hypothetical protein